jgi:gliding motility-associated-like protein
MKKKSILREIGLCIILLSITFSLRSQSYWAQASGGNDVDEAMDVTNDASGNIYSTGYFTNSATFDSYVVTSSSSGIPDGYVYKTNAAGQMQWITKFGGIGSDRGLSIRVDGSGNTYVTGYYYGLSTFGTFTLNSVSGTQDIFIAKLDPSGNFLWVRSAGGSMVDIPSNIAIDNTGDVIVTGSFQGIATFGTATFTSMIDPSTSIYSYDAFTVKYSNSGTYQWCRTGTAKYTDRGLDIVTDANNDIYVCGQFSDTILFNTVHNNNIMNAVYLIKYDATGNEIWFRKASASSSIAYALAVNTNNDVFMSGDFTGTMGFYGPVNNFLTGIYANKMFLAKYDKNGNYIWGAANSSQNYLSARNLALDNAGDAYIIGEYGCTLTDFSDATDRGLFNSIGYADIFVVKHLGSTGARSWMRNIGGPAKDEAHGITLTSVNNPVIAGSYERRFAWPMTGWYTSTCPIYPPTKVYPATWTSSYQAPNYCTDSQYNDYVSVSSAGFSDAFVGRIINLSRQPYDYYQRSGSLCTRPFVKTCINYTSTSCPDTIKMCGPDRIDAITHTDDWLSDGDLGPYHHFKWSTAVNDTLTYSSNISLSGSYNVSVTTMDGCYSSMDTVYVVVHPIPAKPYVTDTKGFNFHKFPNTNLIKMCKPDTVKITGGFIKGNSFAWSVSPGGPWLSTPDSSVITTNGGLYAFTLTSPYGCKAVTTVSVQVDSIKPIIPKINLADSITICCNTPIFVNLYDSITNPTGAIPPCIGIIDTLKWSITPSTAVIATINNCGKPEDGSITTCTTGNYTITAIIKINNLCGVKTYTVTKAVYIKVNPNPTVVLSYTGATQFCPGDSVQVIINHNYPIQWSITGSINSSNYTKDTVWIKIAGYYYISSSYTTSAGCVGSAGLGLNFAPKPNPFLTLYPRLICPNDSVKITCNIPGALNYQWIGPGGPLPGSTPFIWVKIPGFYHCVVTDAQGCVLTSNTVEVKVYNTPYLLANPSAIFCLGGSTVLKVVTNDSTLIQWMPPLFGGGTVKTVTATGTYSVKVTMCGVTTICTVAVVASAAVANITPSSTMLCPGDSIKLTANTGMAGYNWMPGNTGNTSIYVYSGGIYSLTTTDINGCTKTSTISITQNTTVATPTAVPSVSICSGNSATLTAAGSGTVSWYSQPLVGGYLANGNTYTTPPLTKDTIYYASNTTGSCNSIRVPVIVKIIPTSVKPIVSANSPVCKGDTIKLTANNVPGATYNWTGPNSFTSNIQNPFVIVTGTANAGSYFLFLTGGGCTSANSFVNVSVVVPPKPITSSSQSLCVGDTIVLNGYSSAPGATYNWTGPSMYSSNSASNIISPALINQSGVYVLSITSGGCKSDTACVKVLVNNIPLINSYLMTTGCSNDSIVMFADTASGVTYNWSGPGGFTSHSNPVVIRPITSSNAGVYNFYANNSGCSFSSNSFTVNYFPAPVINLGHDTSTCFGSGITFTVGNYPYIMWQDSSNSPIYNIYNTSGLFWVTVADSNGCMASDSVNVVYLECESLIMPNVFTPNGDGTNDIFYIGGNYLRKEKLWIYDRWGTEIYSSEDVDKGWDGTNMRSGKKCDAGTYFYMSDVIIFEGKHKIIKGYVSVYR